MSNGSRSDGAWLSPRLSKDVVPEKYKLFIYPKIKVGTFEGQVLIDIKVIEVTKAIILHQSNLTIEQTKLSSKGSSGDSGEIQILKTWSYPENHYWVVEPSDELMPGSYELYLTFNGNLSANTLGLYKANYSNSANEECSCILSYFEPTYARSAFPCFDEPGFRAVFHIKIAYDGESGYTALSNMCREKETSDYPVVGVNTVHFQATPLMPPYLIAIIVGDFSYTEPIMTKGNVSIAVYSRPDIVTHMKRAQAIAADALDFYSSYFDIPFPLPKLDLIALPDSNIGGMENWGMITFREDCLLLNEESTCDELKDVVSVIAHEISHMWFGDLVTISWWDNLWLKEGFATYMSSVAGAKLFPDWYADWTQLTDSLSAFKMDAPLSSHPLVQVVNTTAEIREVFDAISYQKGCCLIRMLHDLDPEGFQDGIRNYLKRYKYGSTVTQNLWDELQGHIEYDVTSFMDTWTEQMGFPVLTVEYVKGHRLALSQSRFLQNKHLNFDPSSSKYQYKWNVPIKYITSKNLREPKLIWLNKDLESVALETGQSHWVKLNWHQVGFYRVNYPLRLWDLFSLQLLRNPKALDVEDRANLIDDAFNLACAGYFYYKVPLNLLRYFKNGVEDHFYPWHVTEPHLKYLGARLEGTEGEESFRKFIHLLLKANLTEDIWNFEDSVPFLKKKLKLELINLASWSEEPKTLDRIREMFTSWLTDKIPPHPELRTYVYTHGLSHGVTEEIWSQVVDYTLHEATDVNENLKLWTALARVRNVNYLKKLIELAKDENNLKSQNFFIVLYAMASHSIGLQVVWDFVRGEWDYLVERFTLDDLKFSKVLHYVISQFGTEERLNETNAFCEKYPDIGACSRLRQIAIEKMKLNVDWYLKNSKCILEWLRTSDSDDWFDPENEKSVEEFALKHGESFKVSSISKHAKPFILCNIEWPRLFYCRTLLWLKKFIMDEELNVEEIYEEGDEEFEDEYLEEEVNKNPETPQRLTLDSTEKEDGKKGTSNRESGKTLDSTRKKESRDSTVSREKKKR